MAQTYFAILTAIGEAKLANATALGTTLQLTKMAVGDGNGATTIPDRNQTALVHENRRAPLNTLFVDPANASQIVAEQVIPENVGGWWIRELGLFDAAGDLCAVANCPDTYKPELASGSGRTQIIRMVLVVSSTDTISLKIDPAVVLATREQVSKEVSSAIKAHLDMQDPHSQYMTAKEVGDAIANKAEKATTLEGYGITDALPKTGKAADSDLLDGHDSAYFAKASDLAEAGSKPGRFVATFKDTPEPGTLVCNGAAVSRVTYAKLFTAIGTRYGAGDGASTFNLPNIPDGFALLAANGSPVGSSSSGEVKSHSHTATGSTSVDGSHTHGMRVGYTDLDSGNVGGGRTQHSTLETNSAGAHSHTVTVNLAATGAANNLAAGIRVLVCISYE